MGKSTKTVFTCDECKKEGHARSEYDSTPNDPWLVLSVRGGWISPFGEMTKTELHACSPKCTVAILEKATERMRRIVKNFPEGLKGY